MKKLVYLTFLGLLFLSSCSKDEQPEPNPIPKFTIVINSGEGGTVSNQGGSYNQGSKVSVTATPDNEYVFDKWSDGNTENPREITVTSNLTISASFIKKKYNLSVTIEGGGEIQEEILVQGSTSNNEYNSGTTIKLTAIPNEGWEFVGWTGDVESVDNPLELLVDNPKSVTANFVVQTLSFDYSNFGYPIHQFHPEGLGYIELDDKEYILIPFCELQGEGMDYLRSFRIDRETSTIIDETNLVFDNPSEIGFVKGPMLIDDFNEDGYEDFFLVDHGQENERIDGNFKGAYLLFYYGSNQGFVKQNFEGITDLNLFYHHADMGDIDGDGDTDIISQRWSSYDHNVPSGNTISALINNEGEFTINTLENPYSGVGSVLLTNLDEDSDLEVLAGSYSYNDAELWYWDILENTTGSIIQNMGPYPMDDIIEINNNGNSRIFLFSELDDSPVLSSTDKGQSLFESNEIYDYQGRDIIVGDFNADGFDDFFTFYGDDNEGEWGTSFGSFAESLFINDGSNNFYNPESIIDQYNQELSNETNIFFYPLKSIEGGYRFIKFIQEYPLQPPTGGQILDLTIQ